MKFKSYLLGVAQVIISDMTNDYRDVALCVQYAWWQFKQTMKINNL